MAGTTSLRLTRPSWLVADGFRRALVPACWLLAGLLVSHAYLYGLVLVPGWSVAPLPLFTPQAIILSALLLTPIRRWWIYLGVYYVVQVAQGVILDGLPLWYGLLSNVANVLEPLVGALFFRHFVRRTEQFKSLRAVAIYIACVTFGSLIGATWGAATRVFLGSPYWQSWQGWFLADLLASLVLAPTIVLWASAQPQAMRPQSRIRAVEGAFLAVGLLLVGWLTFGTHTYDQDRAPALLYLPVPLLVWSAVRFGPRGVMTALSFLTVLAIAGASNDLGPFVSRPVSANIFTLQLFLLGIGVPLLCLAALVEERQRTQDSLKQSEERYRAVVTSLPHSAVLLFSQDLRHLFADGQGLPESGALQGSR